MGIPRPQNQTRSGLIYNPEALPPLAADVSGRLTCSGQAVVSPMMV